MHIRSVVALNMPKKVRQVLPTIRNKHTNTHAHEIFVRYAQLWYLLPKIYNPSLSHFNHSIAIRPSILQFQIQLGIERSPMETRGGRNRYPFSRLVCTIESKWRCMVGAAWQTSRELAVSTLPRLPPWPFHMKTTKARLPTVSRPVK